MPDPQETERLHKSPSLAPAQPPNADSLEDLLQAQVARVDRRVLGGGNVYASEQQEVRVAATRLHVVRNELGLGRFLGPVGHVKAKPQFLMLFESAAGPVVLKVYGRSRPSEAAVQRLWRAAGVRAVEVVDYGDHPTSWLLMPLLSGQPLVAKAVADEALPAVTGQLAELMAHAYRVGREALRSQPGLVSQVYQPLEEAITKHLGAVLEALRRHGYGHRQDWRDQVRRHCRHPQPSLVHGDLGLGNIIAAPGGLTVLDSAGYAGAPEFDAARWSARVGGHLHAERLLSTWLGQDSDLDEERARALLGCELLMEAGARELVKDEQGQDAQFPDAVTVGLLNEANDLWSAAPVEYGSR